MSLTFYWSPMSTAVLTDLVLEELAVPCERIRVDIRKGETHTQEFLRVNPNGKVPVLVHDGTAIFESAAITLYLGEIFGVARGLYPEPGPQRGEAMKWVVWTNVSLGDAFGRWVRNTSDWFPVEQHNAKAAEAALADTRGCLQILDRALAGREYLLSGYTLADTHTNSLIDWLRFMKVDLGEYQHLNAWSQRCTARPAYGRVMARS
ncbi:MAG TPA: glutathione S-transferase family protein [Steroidobacteraceae bacterium]|nr:glutathione S-transferase family protein [Steroidobacteraceae bacterium]